MFQALLAMAAAGLVATMYGAFVWAPTEVTMGDVQRIFYIHMACWAVAFPAYGVVSVSGLIGFVGIMVPHLVRLLAGSSYRLVLPLSLVVGAAFLILADIPGRMIEHGGETPIGVVTALLGAPMFIYVLRSRRSLA